MSTTSQTWNQIEHANLSCYKLISVQYLICITATPKTQF